MPGELDDDWRLKPVEDEQCEEYIRKDSLLAWLNGVKSDPMIPMNIDKVIDYIKAL